MLTFNDLQEIEKIVRNTVKEETKHLPSKDDYYLKMNELIKEIQTSRQENAVLPQQVGELRDRVDTIENHLDLTTS